MSQIDARSTAIRVSADSKTRRALRTLGGLVALGFACAATPNSAHAQSEVVGWGSHVADSAWNQEPFIDVAVGGYHTLARRADGSAVAWGLNNYLQCAVPALAPGVTYTAIAAGGLHSVALRSDGTVVVWGRSTEGQANVPPLPPGVMYTAIAAGRYFVAAVRSDGALVQWGATVGGVPALPAGVSYVGVSCSVSHSLGLRSDGSVVGWGLDFYGECTPPPLPPGVSYVEVACGWNFSLARRSELGYRISRRTGRSLLASVQQVGTDGTSTLPPVTFTYAETNAPTYAVATNNANTGHRLCIHGHPWTCVSIDVGDRLRDRRRSRRLYVGGYQGVPPILRRPSVDNARPNCPTVRLLPDTA